MKQGFWIRTARALLLGGTALFGSLAATGWALSSPLGIVNNTPYTLQLLGYSMVETEDGARGHFHFHDGFAGEDSSLRPDRFSYIGTGESPTDRIEGYFHFRIKETGENFNSHFTLIGGDLCQGSFQPLDPEQREPGPHPLFSARVFYDCNKPGPRIAGEITDHFATVVLSTAECDSLWTRAACLAERASTGRTSVAPPQPSPRA